MFYIIYQFQHMYLYTHILCSTLTNPYPDATIHNFWRKFIYRVRVSILHGRCTRAIAIVRLSWHFHAVDGICWLSIFEHGRQRSCLLIQLYLQLQIDLCQCVCACALFVHNVHVLVSCSIFLSNKIIIIERTLHFITIHCSLNGKARAQRSTAKQRK